MANVELRMSAQNDLNFIANYFITRNNEIYGEKIIDLIYKTYDNLEEFPEMYPLVPDDTLSEWGFRMIVCEGYISFYRYEENDTAVIYRVFSSRTNYMKFLLSYID
jgi:plasmid stabilization system protein ParE